MTPSPRGNAVAEQPTATTPRAGFRLGLRDAIGTPALVLSASFLGFGSLLRSAGFPLELGLLSSALTWALPGQIVMVELYEVGASLAAITLGVALANLRLMPMVLSLVPRLDTPATPRWQLYLVAQLIAVTSWVNGMRRIRELRPDARLAYMFGLGGTIWAASLVATAIGFLLSGSVPREIELGLIFLNPLYFLLVLVADLRQRVRLMALVLGGALGPLFHLLDPDWGLLATGLVAGTAAYLADRRLARR